MKIKCEICGADIDINLLAAPQDGEIKGSCPSCGTGYTVKQPRKAFDLPSIKFEQPNKVERACVTCGRIFLERPEVAIPVCPECSKPVGAEKAPTLWRIEKNDGNIYGPYSAEEIASLIRDGSLVAVDYAITPAGHRVPLGDTEEFRELFKKPSYSKTQKSSTGTKKYIALTQRKRKNFPATYLMTAAFIITVAIGIIILTSVLKSELPTPKETKEFINIPYKETSFKNIDKIKKQATTLLAAGTPHSAAQAAEKFFQLYIETKNQEEFLPLFIDATAVAKDKVVQNTKSLVVLKKIIQKLRKKFGEQSQIINAAASVYIAGGDFQLALKILSNSKNPRATYLKALASHNQTTLQGKKILPLDDPLTKNALSDSPYPASLLKGAEILEKALYPDKAFSLLKKYLSLYPTSCEALLLKAKILKRSGMINKSFELLKRTVTTCPLWSPARWQIIEMPIIYFPTLTLDLIPTSTNIIKNNLTPLEKDKFYGILTAYYLLKREFKKALSVVEGEGKNHIDPILKARTYYKNGLYKRALDILGDPELASTIEEKLLIGDLLFATGKYKQAYSLINSLLKVDSKSTEPYLHKALWTFKKNGPNKSALVLSSAFGKTAVDDRNNLSPWEMQIVTELLQALRGVSSAEGTAAKALLTILIAEKNQRKIPEALNILTTLSKWKKFKSPAALYASRLALIRGDTKSAASYLSKVNPSQIDRTAFIYNSLLINAHTHSPNMAEYIQKLEPTDLPPSLSEYVKGIISFENKNYEEGATYLRKALELSPSLSPAYKTLFNVEKQMQGGSNG